MKLSRLGEFIEQIEGRNKEGKFGVPFVRGISTKKEFISTKADMEGVSIYSYKIVSPQQFAYVADTSRRGEKISLAYNDSDQPFLVSSITTVFHIRQEKLSDLHPLYLYIYLSRPEFDRYSRFNSWGSAREAFTWESMCEIDVFIPSIAIQMKYVEVYNALVANQKAYELGLNDLKLVSDAYIEELRRKCPVQAIGKHIEQVIMMNKSCEITNIKGVSASEGFIETKANMIDIDLAKYQIVLEGCFAFTPTRINIGSIALYKGEPCIVSPFYEVFRVKSNTLISDYLLIWLKRNEFYRYTLFKSDGNIRQTFDYYGMTEVEIPIPDVEVQRAIANVYIAFEKRKQINERLKKQIANVCPILIKGSIEEAIRG
jgi:type I restriction enzyme S subunit